MKKYFKAKVEKGHEIPPKKERGGKYINFLNSLEVGDSFFVEDENDANGIRQAGYWVGRKFTVRKTYSDKDIKKFTFRMWYTEKVEPITRRSKNPKSLSLINNEQEITSNSFNDLTNGRIPNDILFLAEQLEENKMIVEDMKKINKVVLEELSKYNTNLEDK